MDSLVADIGEDESEPNSSEIDSLEAEIGDVDRQIRHLEARRAELLERKKRIEALQEKRRSDQLRQRDWEGEGFSWSRAVRERMKTVFALTEFRALQLSAINAILSKLDIFLVMPTGGGKSLCYQLPSLLARGFTLVVCPLVSLMEDQVLALKKLNINAEMMNADTAKEKVSQIFSGMTDEKFGLKLLYVTPEKLAKSKRFMTKLQQSYQEGLFCYLAIDEVHCCSQWGHDFRPDYKFLGVMRSLFPQVPIMGLTATSTSQVTEDCKKMLNLRNCLVFKSPFNRKNLFYEVRLKPESHDDCVKEIGHMLSTEFKGQSGIIYTLSVKDVENLTKDLRQLGLKVAPYHAYLDGSSRSKIHQAWLDGTYQAVVATIAFGMGINKSNVRFVLHHCISKSIENFYQESGRAGRDDGRATCIAFFKFADVFRLSTMVFTEQTGLDKLYSMVAYCQNIRLCRRSIIADHFSETWDSSECEQMCDVCCSRYQLSNVDITPYVDIVGQIIVRAEGMDVKLTGLKVLNALLGKGDAKHKIPNWKGGELNKEFGERIIIHLLLEGFLKEDFAFTPYTTISYIVRGPLFSTSRKWMITCDPGSLGRKAKRQRESSASGKAQKRLRQRHQKADNLEADAYDKVICVTDSD